MRKILPCAAIVTLVLLGWSAVGAVPAQKKAPAKKSPAKSAAPAKKKTPVKQSASRSAAPAKKKPATSKKGKKAPAKRTTWRNRQLAPTAQRYQEIQNALVAKGYLKPEDAGGVWNPASVDALKKFQAGQNLESTGKINALSLIALGLGPKHENAVGQVPDLPSR
jgi:hypothetical protein